MLVGSRGLYIILPLFSRRAEVEEEVGGVWIGEGVRRHLGGLLDKSWRELWETGGGVRPGSVVLNSVGECSEVG